MYDQGGDFLGHKFRNSLIEEEYGINTKHSYLGNPQANTIVERIHQVQGNLALMYTIQENFVDDDDPWMGILAGAAFVVQSIYHHVNGKIPVQSLFG